jgi:hypothetical protein
MDERTEQPYWAFLFQDFISDSDPVKLNTRLGPLEGAIFERLQELSVADDGHEERVAIQMASDKLLEIKTQKLGFPPFHALVRNYFVAAILSRRVLISRTLKCRKTTASSSV